MRPRRVDRAQISQLCNNKNQQGCSAVERKVKSHQRLNDLRPESLQIDLDDGADRTSAEDAHVLVPVSKRRPSEMTQEVVAVLVDPLWSSLVLPGLGQLGARGTNLATSRAAERSARRRTLTE